MEPTLLYTPSGKTEKKGLIEQHAPLVKKIAQQMKMRLPANVELNDLIQAGMMGLMDAVTRYEESFGAQFETYASQRIRGAILDELRSHDWLPRGTRQNMRRIEEAITTLEQQFGRSPNEQEVAQHLKMSLTEYQLMLDAGAGHQLLYYEDFKSEDGESFFDGLLVDEGANPLASLLEKGFRDALVAAIAALPEREALVMGLYYEQEMNLKEIGAVMGVTESRICQLHSQAIARLRSHLKAQQWTGPAS